MGSTHVSIGRFVSVTWDVRVSRPPEVPGVPAIQPESGGLPFARPVNPGSDASSTRYSTAFPVGEATGNHCSARVMVVCGEVTPVQPTGTRSGKGGTPAGVVV